MHRNLGNGKNGMLVLTVSQQVYMSINEVLFIYPMNPGPIPVIPDVAAASRRTDDWCFISAQVMIVKSQCINDPVDQ